MNIEDGSLYIIEVNTIPGLTPSTVLFHQALAENPPIYPNEFLRMQVLIALSSSNTPTRKEDAGDGFLDDDYFDENSNGGDEDEYYDEEAYAPKNWASQQSDMRSR